MERFYFSNIPICVKVTKVTQLNPTRGSHKQLRKFKDLHNVFHNDIDYWILILQTLRNFKLYKKLIQKITSVEDVQTLGLHLECDPYDIEYHLNKNQPCFQKTAFEILWWFEENCMDDTEKWGKLIEALTEMGRRKTVVELGLYKLRDEAASK